MGAAPSKSPAHVNGRFVNQFFGWNPEMIERALVRIKQTAPSMRVNARDFWQVFSDYEVQCTATHLCCCTTADR